MANVKLIGRQKRPLTSAQALEMLDKEDSAVTVMPSHPRPHEIYLFRGEKDQGTHNGWKCDSQKWSVIPWGIHLYTIITEHLIFICGTKINFWIKKKTCLI